MNLSKNETARCWRCGVPVNSRSPMLCLDCHAREVALVHQHDTPDVPEVSTVGRYEPPYERAVRPHSSGRRVIRKAEPLAG